MYTFECFSYCLQTESSVVNSLNNKTWWYEKAAFWYDNESFMQFATTLKWKFVCKFMECNDIILCCVNKSESITSGISTSFRWPMKLLRHAKKIFQFLISIIMRMDTRFWRRWLWNQLKSIFFLVYCLDVFFIFNHLWLINLKYFLIVIIFHKIFIFLSFIFWNRIFKNISLDIFRKRDNLNR